MFLPSTTKIIYLPEGMSCLKILSIKTTFQKIQRETIEIESYNITKNQNIYEFLNS
ncbi:hypothetical protein KFK09_004079 [Dendrobium nobile]|uniref:Uncharacterized protein n=1 Tax=Dendrobium nobile TaxID=94219 RepID=A0A8T3C4S9_DENNO|nr:hypothetical protein KFK09_004079 [Dendrobium nobile]